jgi:hypothetical protein
MLGDYELPSVTRLETLEHRGLIEIPIIGRAGSVFQDPGRSAARMILAGSVFGEEGGQDFLNSVREKYLAGEPLTFVSDIATGTEIEYVLVERLHVQADASHPDQLDYTVWLVESPPPPPPTNVLDGIDTSLLDQAQGLLDTAMGALDALDALGNVPNLSDPTKPLSGALDEVEGGADEVGQFGTSLTSLLGG